MQSYEQFVNKNFEKEKYETEKLRMKRQKLITEHDQPDSSKREDSFCERIKFKQFLENTFERRMQISIHLQEKRDAVLGTSMRMEEAN